MVFSAQEFQWITGINLATQYLVYLPLMLLVETKAFGEVSLFQLQLPLGAAPRNGRVAGLGPRARAGRRPARRPRC